jgi:hypothetical protein
MRRAVTYACGVRPVAPEAAREMERAQGCGGGERLDVERPGEAGIHRLRDAGEAPPVERASGALLCAHAAVAAQHVAGE